MKNSGGIVIFYDNNIPIFAEIKIFQMVLEWVN